MNYSVGSLVRVRERDWVVLPGTSDELVMVRPLGGTDAEMTGILPTLEEIEPAHFDLPDPEDVGDFISCKLLRDALRIGFRSSAGPFRCFGKIAVEPRPYQLVPLLMALKLEPVRILIADDVGIGKTIEAALIARELLDRGEIENIAVLCPPQLAEQWQKELSDKFHIDAELVLPSTARKLEKKCRLGESLFEHYPFVIVSMDYIKSDKRRDEFLRSCPEFVIVDEAHTCARGDRNNRGRHQRYELVSGLSRDENRHMVLVTATPHSGKEEAFRSLLTFLKPDFADLPEDLTGSENEHRRRDLARYFVQRKRGNIKDYLGEETKFPERSGTDVEENYNLSAAYQAFSEKIIAYVRESVQEDSDSAFKQRVRWWSALALLRSLASSPAAAAATLRTRAASADTEDEQQADEVGKHAVLDLMDDDTAESIDVTPGSDLGDLAQDAQNNRRRLLDLARSADKLQGIENDLKLKKAIDLIKGLIKDGYRPIIFCRFIPTVEYVTNALREHLSGKVEVVPVTGHLPPAERESRVAAMSEFDKRVLVCTDCLSEGINLQDHFNAVMHYDLSWNPTRHEQREGRVDRFGQPSPQVKVITYYGIDNQIDGIVLDVLLRKHKTIRNSLGVSVPVPAKTDQVIEAVFEGLLLRGQRDRKVNQLILPGFEEYLQPQKEDLHRKWDAVHDREKRSRAMFAQATIKVDEVAEELRKAREAIGTQQDVAWFTKQVLKAHKAVISENGALRIDIKEMPLALKDILNINKNVFNANFDLPVKDDVLYLNRTHPLVEGLANYVLDTTLDPGNESITKRCGAIRTRQVEQRTILVLCRFRFHIINVRSGQEKVLLSEEASVFGFNGGHDDPQWLSKERINALLEAQPDANITPDMIRHQVRRTTDNFTPVQKKIDNTAQEMAEELAEAHKRVRSASNLRGVTYKVRPLLPVDVLGIYVFLPLAE